MNISKVDIENDFERFGFSVFKNILDDNFLDKIRIDLDYWINYTDELRVKNGLGKVMRGVAHQVLGRDDSLSEFIKLLPLHEVIKFFFDGPYILNGYCGLINIDGVSQDYLHVQNFHRDVRTYTDFKLMINMLVMVDDFKIDNGATLLLPGSHKFKNRPTEEYLKKNSIYMEGSAGTVVLFDSRLWHAASKNLNGDKRRALTATYTRPFVKQQMDFVKLVGDDFSQNEDVKQVIGWKSRVPESHSDWYQPSTNRFYHSDQG